MRFRAPISLEHRRSDGRSGVKSPPAEASFTARPNAAVPNVNGCVRRPTPANPFHTAVRTGHFGPPPKNPRREIESQRPLTVQLSRTAVTESPLASVESIIAGLAGVGYIASRRIATALFMAEHLQKPVLVEGVAGVGKTELAIATATLLDLPLIRMQCYEGLDESKALYEWKYGKQLLYTQILKDRMGEALADAHTMEAAMDRLHGMGDMFFSEPFMEPRPILKALQSENGCVLLIDEIDKSDEAFEAFLLEVLSAFQASIPEVGTIKAKVPPLVFLTSNNVRDLGDALKRRCLHLHIPLPDARLEERIVATRVPGVEANLTRELVAFVQSLRTIELRKVPSISETVDWARALVLLHADALSPDVVRETLNVLLKFEQDIVAVEPKLNDLLGRAAEAGQGA
jgi:MoxR-like ATPase